MLRLLTSASSDDSCCLAACAPVPHGRTLYVS